MPLGYVLINVELGSEEQVLGEVRKVPNVKECHRLYGLRHEFNSADRVTWYERVVESLRIKSG